MNSVRAIKQIKIKKTEKRGVFIVFSLAQKRKKAGVFRGEKMERSADGGSTFIRR